MVSSIRADGSDGSDDWSKWKGFNSKKYSDKSVDTVRRSIFEKNLKRINQHNSKNSSFKMALNAFSDLSDQELAASYTIKINEKSVKALIKNASVFMPDRRSARSPVDSVNWVTAGYVAPIRNQGSCGACYAFSTVNNYFTRIYCITLLICFI
jgi:cathepsin L